MILENILLREIQQSAMAIPKCSLLSRICTAYIANSAANHLARHIAHAATIFRIDEIVVFDNKNTSEDDSIDLVENHSDEYETGAAFLIRILRYLETPQYLMSDLFPKNNSLRFVGY